MIIDATITKLRRTQKRSVEYTLEYVADGRVHTISGKSSTIWSWLVPHGFDVSAVEDGEHRVNIPCEYNLATRRIANIPMPGVVIETPAMPIAKVEPSVIPVRPGKPIKRGKGWLLGVASVVLVAVTVTAILVRK